MVIDAWWNHYWLSVRDNLLISTEHWSILMQHTGYIILWISNNLFVWVNGFKQPKRKAVIASLVIGDYYLATRLLGQTKKKVVWFKVLHRPPLIFENWKTFQTFWHFVFVLVSKQCYDTFLVLIALHAKWKSINFSPFSPNDPDFYNLSPNDSLFQYFSLFLFIQRSD